MYIYVYYNNNYNNNTNNNILYCIYCLTYRMLCKKWLYFIETYVLLQAKKAFVLVITCITCYL